MWQIVEYFNYNPESSAKEAISYFEEQFEHSKQINALKVEADEVARIRSLLRPLFGEKADLNERIKYVVSDIEMEVYIQYPPRKGSDAERETLRNKLKKGNESFQSLNTQLKEVGRKIVELEDELDEVDRRAKNARRLTELLQAYILFINEYKGGSTTQLTATAIQSNANIF